MNWRAYDKLVATRFAAGELIRFNCAACGKSSLDPVGADTVGRPLCEECADPIPREDDDRKPNLSRLRRGTRSEFDQVARVRNLETAALERADRMGTLRFGILCGLRSWILTDCSGYCAEGRPVDGNLYPTFRSKDFELGERKAQARFATVKNLGR